MRGMVSWKWRASKKNLRTRCSTPCMIGTPISRAWSKARKGQARDGWRNPCISLRAEGIRRGVGPRRPERRRGRSSPLITLRLTPDESEQLAWLSAGMMDPRGYGAGKKDQRPQAPSAHRRAGLAAAVGRPSRQRPGPRRPGAGLRPSSRALSPATAPVRRCRRGARAPAARDRQATARCQRLPSPAASPPGRNGPGPFGNGAASAAVIERSFAIRQRRCRIGRNRWLARDFEGPIDATTAMVALAIIQLLDLFPPAEYANGGYPRSA